MVRYMLNDMFPNLNGWYLTLATFGVLAVCTMVGAAVKELWFSDDDEDK